MTNKPDGEPASRFRMRINVCHKEGILKKLTILPVAVLATALLAACGSSGWQPAATESQSEAAAPVASSTPGTSGTTPPPGGFSGQASLTDTQGYTLTLDFSGSLEAPYTSITNDPPGQEDINASMNLASVTLTNTTPGRNLPDDFDEDLGGIQIGGFWPSKSPLCAASALDPIYVTFPTALGGSMCYIEVAMFADPGGLGQGQSVDLSLQQGTTAGLTFSDEPETQQSAFESAIESGPTLWAVTSVDQTNQFGATCAPDANMQDLIAAQVYVLGITPHTAAVPACQYTPPDD
jgi:hypothetical protein